MRWLEKLKNKRRPVKETPVAEVHEEPAPPVSGCAAGKHDFVQANADGTEYVCRECGEKRTFHPKVEEVPPEVLDLTNYFERGYPSIFFDYSIKEYDSIRDETHINWLVQKGEDIEQTVKKFLEFIPKCNDYNNFGRSSKTQGILDCISWHMSVCPCTFIIVDSLGKIPADEEARARLKELCGRGPVHIVMDVAEGVYHDLLEDTYYDITLQYGGCNSIDCAEDYYDIRSKKISTEEATALIKERSVSLSST